MRVSGMTVLPKIAFYNLQQQETTVNKIVIYNHGKDSSPWGEKTQVFADIAKQHDYQVLSPDYSHQLNPDKRVKQLLAIDLSANKEVILIGSSMGAYVATVAAETIQPSGLFLLAPAVYLPGYQQTEFSFSDHQIQVVHGWQDEIVPVENAWKLCQKYHLRLKLYDADHRLMSVIAEIAKDFDDFLISFIIDTAMFPKSAITILKRKHINDR